MARFIIFKKLMLQRLVKGQRPKQYDIKSFCIVRNKLILSGLLAKVVESILRSVYDKTLND